MEIDYARAAPMSASGTLLLRPADRDALLTALRAHALRADFDFFPSAAR
jgi:hypothetical protein